MEIPIWLILLVALGKLAVEAGQVISTHVLQARKLELKYKKRK